MLAAGRQECARGCLRRAWDSWLPRWLFTRRRARPPVFDRGDDLLGRVFLDVVRGPAEDVGPVVGEGTLLPPTVGPLHAPRPSWRCRDRGFKQANHGLAPRYPPRGTLGW